MREPIFREVSYVTHFPKSITYSFRCEVCKTKNTAERNYPNEIRYSFCCENTSCDAYHTINWPMPEVKSA